MSDTGVWDGSFTLNLQSNARCALQEFNELDAFMETAAHWEAPDAVHIAVSVAWSNAKNRLALHRDCIAQFSAPWFDGSAFK